MMNEKDSLIHYASKYYDPVKAHEYYMRTRELKGRRSTANLSDEGKKVWSYTKNEISTQKKADVEARKSERDAALESIRSNAKATRESISKKLEQLKAALAESSKKERESVAKKTSSEIEKVLAEEMPKGLSKKQRIKWIAEKDKKIAKLRADAGSDLSKISKDAKQTSAEYSEDASNQRAAVATKLKSTIEATRAAYTAAKKSLDESYESIYQAEYDKILSEYGKKKK